INILVRIACCLEICIITVINLVPREKIKATMTLDRVGPLFARRRQYEYQQLLGPVRLRSPGCSLLGQSCSRLSGCCEACATCHCRFFSAICFCRKANVQCERKKLNTIKARQRQKQIHSENQ
uniref:Agouti domain-containing protein n=1 Tax=Oryzias sinensis TaxID=183150 RepID=A0A8C7ZKQ2_9TELE